MTQRTSSASLFKGCDIFDEGALSPRRNKHYATKRQQAKKVRRPGVRANGRFPKKRSPIKRRNYGNAVMTAVASRLQLHSLEHGTHAPNCQNSEPLTKLQRLTYLIRAQATMQPVRVSHLVSPEAIRGPQALNICVSLSPCGNERARMVGG